MKKVLRQALKQIYFATVLKHRGSFQYFGSRVYFPRHSHIAERAIAEGIYERETLDVLCHFVRPNTTCIDIGANIGLLSLPVLVRHPSSHVLSFEPAPSVAAQLQRTRDESPHASRWSILPVCLADTPGSVTLHVPADGRDAFSATVQSVRHQHARQFTVPVSTLDGEWNRLGRPAISAIKIDVEGGERKVLGGGNECIRDQRPIIVTEWNGTNLVAHGESPGFLVHYCAENGYRLLAMPDYFEVREESALLLVMRHTENFLLVPLANR